MQTDMSLLEELADCIPGDAGRLDGARSRLLGVQEIMRTLTDSDHGLTVAEIRGILRFRNWQSCKLPSEPAILEDLHVLSESDLSSLVIETPSRGTNAGFRCLRTALSSAQVRLLINMVRTCKFITLEECRELCEALENMISIYQQDTIVEDVVIDERIRPSQPDAFTAADIAAQAIRTKRKIAFQYCYRGLDGREHLIEGTNGTTTFIETPIALVFSFGNYYLETWPADVDLGSVRKHRSRRLDRMRSPELIDEPAEDNDEIRRLKESVADRTAQTFDMLGDGISRTIFLRVNASASNVVYDRFGHDLIFEHVMEYENELSIGYACVNVQLSPTFYRWLFGMGDSIEIVKPINELWALDGSWGALTYMKSIDALVEDYEAALKGYAKQFIVASRPYHDLSIFNIK